MELLRAGRRGLGIFLLCLCVPASAIAICSGDCDGGGTVTVDELVRGVNIALGIVAVDDCPQFDGDSSDTVSVDEIIVAVQNALNGCPQDTTPTVGGATVTPTARPTTPSTPNFIIRGKVLQAASGGGGVSPVGDAEIQVSVDRDGNGVIGAGESSLGSADGEGTYILDFGVVAGDNLVVEYRSGDSAPLFRTLEAAPGGDITLNVTLRTAEELTCEASRCALRGDRLTIDGLPADVTGSAQLFNPVTQPDAFPGEFSDSDGNLLLSGVFASVELTNAFGQPVKQLAAPATLRMQIPRETWPIVSDITAGNGRIDVPLYAFDEAAGTWVRDGAAVLETDQGDMIPESSLASIRSGSFAGNVVASGQVQHFSYWNIDWPVDKHGCTSGRLLDDSGQPARGASITIRGLTYVGVSATSTDSDGRFCADVMRSESAGEDVDQDGVLGETQRVAVRVAYNGHIYAVGELDVPAQSASCGGLCASLGEVRLTPDRELHPTLCSLVVNVRDRNGAPVPGAFVGAVDDSIDFDVVLDLCSDQPLGFCESTGATDANGDAHLTTVLLDTLFIVGLATTQDGQSTLQRWGDVTQSNGCPTAPLVVTLTEGFRQILLTLQFTPPNRIEWTPATPVTSIGVSGAQSVKWLVGAMPPGFNPPLNYGTVPAGAFQLIPTAGAPPALASGDLINIVYTAPGDDGYPIIGQGFTFVP